jgi:hypothetical protein
MICRGPSRLSASLTTDMVMVLFGPQNQERKLLEIQMLSGLVINGLRAQTMIRGFAEVSRPPHREAKPTWSEAQFLSTHDNAASKRRFRWAMSVQQ